MPGAVSEILSRCRISEVAYALTGEKPRRTGKETFRARATWREGDGWNVSLDDPRGVWHDFTSGEGGGVLDLVVRVHGGNRADALRWAADLAGVPLDDRPLSPDERERWVLQRRVMALELPKARYWRRATIAIGEELLCVLKAAFFDGQVDQIDFDGIRDTERLLAALRRIDGAELVAEFHSWMQTCPQLTTCMMLSAQTRETAERSAIEVYMGMNLVEASRT